MGQKFIGYSGLVWSTVYQTMGYYSAQLSTLLNTPTTDFDAIAQLSDGMLATLNNALQAVNADALATAWNNEFTTLEQIQALPLILDPTTASYFNARTDAYGAALPDLLALIPSVSSFLSPNVISNGMAAIPDPGLLEYFENFFYETPPALTTPTSIYDQALAMVTAWNNVANAVSVYQGANLTQLYDAAQREATAAAFAAEIINSYTSGPIFYDTVDTGGIGSFIIGVTPIGGAFTNPWDQVAALPAMAAVGAVLSSTPNLVQNQQQAVIRNILLTYISKIELFLVSLRQPSITQTNLATVLVGETLLDVAARATGSFENWQAIAEINGLSPPYTGPIAAPGIAVWGSQLVLPAPGVTNSAVGSIPSYSTNFLGVDLYTGPINGVMPPWTGDFQIIQGYRNLAWALGRRLQTTQGNFIYHKDYGSRIPPQVGAVQDQQTAGHIAAFGKSACLADPRVVAVPRAAVQIQANQKVAFSAIVQPGGFQATIAVNEVLSPTP